MRNVRVIAIAAVASLFPCISTARGELNISVGDHALLPNAAGQTVDLVVSGGDPAAGIALYLIVGDGSSGPTITDVDVLTGTIFGAVPNFGQFDQGSESARKWAWGTLLSSGDVAGNGKIATITLDTTSLFSGSWDLILDDGSANFGITDFAGTPVNITQGSLNIPEPMTVNLLSIGLAAVLVRRRVAD